MVRMVLVMSRLSSLLIVWRMTGIMLVTSALAPDEQAGHGVVPDHAHQRAGRARQPPDRFLVVDRERDTDIGEQSDAAHDVEQQQTAHERKALQPLVAIGQ